jgi:predicted  nucleic acid-binding Zn-ribbon protein
MTTLHKTAGELARAYEERLKAEARAPLEAALAESTRAREQLADKHMRLKELYDVKYRAHEQAERERDTALARMKEAQLQAVDQQSRRCAAESDMASAL